MFVLWAVGFELATRSRPFLRLKPHVIQCSRRRSSPLRYFGTLNRGGRHGAGFITSGTQLVLTTLAGLPITVE